MAIALALTAAERVYALDYPNKTITIVVPYPPGGSSDAQARLIAKGLAERLSKPVVVDNRPGAGGRIGAAFAARAAPDGHTLFFGTVSQLVIEPVLRTNVGFDPLRDFVPITIITEMPFVLVVSASFPAKKFPELLAYARSRPGTLTYASWGPGSSGHLVGEMFKASVDVDILHVPYKGEAPAITDVIGRQVSMIFATPVVAIPHIKGGKLQAMALTGTKRLRALPEVPTFRELGVEGVELQTWSGIMVPAKTPPQIAVRLHSEITAVLRSPEFARSASGWGAVVVAGSPKDFAHRIQSESASIAKVVQAVNLRVED